MTGSPPSEFGRFELLELIARGGMGEVHRARLRGPHGFSREVALKRLLPTQRESRPDEGLQMFYREARLAARIKHPNVVSVLDFGVEDGVPWLSMEYVTGFSVRQLLAAVSESAQPVPLPVVSSILCDLLAGLDAAHQNRDDSGAPQPIVHRDVSPSNVLLRSDGVAQVIDFGVARTEGDRLTTSIVIKGKLPYVAPEQLDGLAVPATDLYAAGVILWELLIGRGLIRGRDSKETLARVLRGQHPRPSTLRADVPEALDEVVVRALSTDPAQRPESAARMAAELAAAVAPALREEVARWAKAVRVPLASGPAKVSAAAADATVTAFTAAAPRRSARFYRSLLSLASLALLLSAAALAFTARPPSGAAPVLPEVVTGRASAPTPGPPPPEATRAEPAPAEPEPVPPKTQSVARKKRSARCATPWYYDDDGIKRYHRDCL